MRRFKSLRLAKISALGVVAIVAGLFLLIFLFIDHNINPAIISFSQAKIQAIAINSLSDAVKKTLGTNIKYTDFVNVLTDKNGNVAMLQANTMKMNDLAAQVSDMAQETIRSKGDEGIDIPLGTITGSKLLAGMGQRYAKNHIIPQHPQISILNW